MKQKERGTLYIIISCAAVAAIAAIYIFNPETTTFYPPCLFHTFTGLHCPGCGTARGLHRLLHGDIADALSMNAFTILALPAIAYYLVAETLTIIANRAILPMPRIPEKSGWVLFGFIILFTILRNIPLHPLTLLAPH